MLLSPVTKLGLYEIVSLGGMGDVYRTRDERLGRDVAVKMLPDVLAKDAQRRERFRQEARTVAQIRHPNACTLHDIAEEWERIMC